MNTIPTNQDGLSEKDEREIQKMIRRCLREGYYTTKKEKDELKAGLYQEFRASGKSFTRNEIAKTLLALEQTDLKRLEVFDKIDRLDRGDVTDRSESFTIIINEDRAAAPPPANANSDAQPVPQAD